jgi:hypothetical protein
LGTEISSSFRSIHNLSDHVLLESEERLLEKGLSFIPKNNVTSVSKLEIQHKNFVRSLKIKYYFLHNPPFDYCQNQIFKPDKPSNFRLPSKWIPPDYSLGKECLNLVKKLDSDFKDTLDHFDIYKITHKSDGGYTLNVKNPGTPNLSKQELGSIGLIKSDKDIIIKPADKGNSIVILNKENYKVEAYRQLLDKTYYEELQELKQSETAIKIGRVVRGLLDDKFISSEQYRFLLPPCNPRPRIFYLLPKIHKDPSSWPDPKMPPGRPVISNCSSESSNVSKFIDYFLLPLANKHSSYIKNSYDFVEIIKNKNVNRNDLLVTADVTSLYTNMRLDLTIDAVRRQFAKNPDPNRPDYAILRLLNIILHNNDFVFDNRVFLQKCGTAIGLSCAPNLANIFMLDFDSRALQFSGTIPKFFYRYLDDLFFVYSGTVQELREYEKYLNSLIPGIKLSFSYDLGSVDFLDTTVFKHFSGDSITLQTKIFFKPTDTHQLLHNTSFHPKHVFNSIIKSQLIRFKMLSSFKHDYNQTCNILWGGLKTRGYSRIKFVKMKRFIFYNHKVGSTKQTVDSIPNRVFLPIPMTFCPFTRKVMHRYKDTLKGCNTTREWRTCPAYINQRNLKSYFVSSKFL